MGIGIELIVQEMPPDGSKCVECNEVIYGKMFQYFIFENEDYDPKPSKFKYCVKCYEDDEETII